MADYKDMIQCRADELASSMFNRDFYDLPPTIASNLYSIAESQVVDDLAAQADAMRDAVVVSDQQYTPTIGIGYLRGAAAQSMGDGLSNEEIVGPRD